MKALLVAELPGEGAARWAYEFKWDGVRALAFFDGSSFQLFSRNHKDATFRYPEIAELGEALGKHSAILDGEIIAVAADGNPSFTELQKRMNVTRPAAVERLAREVPVQYVIFDALYLDGQDLRKLLWEQRRERLESLAPLLPPACCLSPARLGSAQKGTGGQRMLEVAKEKGLEGVVAKRIDSVYEEGARSGSWLKIKLVQEQELVVGGWVPAVSGDGKVHHDHVGAILLGYHDRAGGRGKFHFAGAVGTGFTHQRSAEMVKRLKKLRAAANPFDDSAALRKFRAPVQFVRPEVVVQVEYRRWPAGGLMHQAAFKGVREDKAAKEVVREIPAEPVE